MGIYNNPTGGETVIEPLEDELDSLAVIVLLAWLLEVPAVSTYLLSSALSAAVNLKGCTAVGSNDMAGSLTLARKTLESLCRPKEVTQEELDADPVYAFTSYDSDIIETGTAGQLNWLFEGKTEPPNHPRLRRVLNAETLKRYRRLAYAFLQVRQELWDTSEPIVKEDEDGG